MTHVLTSRENDCRSCYKCIRSCPTKSISFHDGQARIIFDECVLCGKCYLVCPQHCKIIRSDLERAKALIDEGEEVYASLAPSFRRVFPESAFPEVRKALLQLGFKDVEETAIGATIVKKRYDEIASTGEMDVIISTCCHSINLLVEKHYPELTKYLAPVLSPMLMHGEDLKKRHPNAKVVFLGPCISKKNEIELYPGKIDVVLTFLELKEWLESQNIQVEKSRSEDQKEESKARLFPVEGGILATMERKAKDYQYMAIGGMEDALSTLEDLKNGKIHHAFLEMSACSGSCVNGPATGEGSWVSSTLLTRKQAGKKDFAVASYSEEEVKQRFFSFSLPHHEHSEEEIASILKKIGKRSAKDELNCSSCGYPTCRAKALAVLDGKASLEMCLPYLMDKATSLGNTVVEGSDNAIIVLNEELEIQLANPCLVSLVGAKDASDLKGKPVNALMDPEPFALALAGTPIRSKKIYLPEYEKYLEASISYDERFHVIVAIMRDVTEEVRKKEHQKEITLKTAEITSEVIEKNMRAVQEIASLLGESTAETKLALTKLQEALARDNDNGD